MEEGNVKDTEETSTTPTGPPIEVVDKGINVTPTIEIVDTETNTSPHSGHSSNSGDSSASSSASRFAHLWTMQTPVTSMHSFNGTPPLTTGAGVFMPRLVTPEVSAMLPRQPMMGLGGFGELSLGESVTVTTVTRVSTNSSEHMYSVAEDYNNSHVFRPEPYIPYFGNQDYSGLNSGPPGFPVHNNGHIPSFGPGLDIGGSPFESTRSGYRRDFGFEAPLMSSSPFQSDLDETPLRHAASFSGSYGGISEAINEIAALLGETNIDWNSSAGSDQSWSPVVGTSMPGGSNSCVTIKQTLRYLQILQDLQNAANSIQMDPARRNQIFAKTASLQDILLNQYASPVPIPMSKACTSSDHLEQAAKFHREVAGCFSDPKMTWSGVLPARNTYRNPMYSCKVFLGGVPWDITESTLSTAFRAFGNVRIEWPGKDGNQPKGYAYVIFDTDKQVKSLLQNCTHDYVKGADYFKLSSRRTRQKDVQVIPWAITDSNFVRCPATRLDPQKTIFVGALHGMLNAEGLCHVMQELFGGVVYAGIDTDRYKYPIGSGRVTFNNTKSYMKAVAAAFIEIRTSKFTKKVQVDPYLEDATCSVCNLQQGPYFCRSIQCFNYFCRTCFQFKHTTDEFRSHGPLMRNTNKTHGGPITIMPSGFSATTTLTEISHSNGNRHHQMFGSPRARNLR